MRVYELKAGHSKRIDFLHDALGSVRDIVDSNGNVVQRYEFDERGNHLISPMSGGPASPKSFVGGLSVNDDTGDSGLYLMGHRFYDPTLGRFLNRDPIGHAGGLNLFSYAANNPSTLTDHTGLQPSSGTGMSFSDFMNQARKDVGAFFNHLLDTAGFIPGPAGVGATGVDLITQSPGEGGGSLPFLVGLPPAMRALLKTGNRAKKLQKILKKHLSGKHNFDCVKTADNLLADLRKLGIPGSRVKIKADTDFMFFEGQMFSKNRKHQAVRIGNRVFDKVITGPPGLPIDEFKAIMRESSVNPTFKGLD